MPKGLLLLLLLLLVGGYFAFTSLSGGQKVYELPYLDASAKVVQGAKGYTAVLDGALKLPAKGKYTIQSLSASLLINGVSVQTKNLVESPTEVEGPSSFPISFSPDFAPSANNVAVSVEGNVVSGKSVYVVSAKIPVALPDKSTLAKDPAISVSLSSVKLLGPTKSVILSIRIYNPNGAKMSFGKISVSRGEEVQDLGITDVPGKGSAEDSIAFSLPADVTSLTFTLSGDYSVNGVSRTLNQSFEMNVPILSEQPLSFDVQVKSISLDRSGYELNVFGSVENPNAFNVTLSDLKVEIVKNFGEGNVYQSVDLLKDVDLLPNGKKSFAKTFTVASFLSGASARVVAAYNGKDHVVARFPLPVINPADFIDPVSITLKVTNDGNACTLTPLLSGPDYNVDVSLKISAGDNNKDYGSFVLSGSKTLDAISPLTGTVLVSAEGMYGIENVGVWLPIRVNAEFNCPT